MRAAIEGVLASDAVAAVRAAEEPFERTIAGARRPVVLVGAGEVGRNALRVLRQRNIDVACFSDNSPVKWGSTLDGTAVLSPHVAGTRFGGAAVFVVAYKCNDAAFAREQARLRRFGVQTVCHISVLLQKWPEIAGWPAETAEFYQQRTGRILEVFDLLADDESRRQFAGHLRWRVLRDYSALPSGELHDQYFREEIIRLAPDECFVDGGAFDGDSIRAFLYDRCEQFAAIHAFEPDPGSFAALQSFIGSLGGDIAARVTAHPFALSDREGVAEFTALGNHSSFLGGAGATASVRTVALDEFLADQRISFIKLDLEGGEGSAITGAEATLRNQRPILTVAVYHGPSDLLDIPLRLRELCSDYRYYLRTHNSFGLDTVLYAVPRSRAI